MADYGAHLGHNAEGVLEFDGVTCDELAERFGTPLFVVSESQIRTNVARMQRALAAGYEKSVVLFATKANNNLAVRRVYTLCGAGGDAFGPSELSITLSAGTSPSLIVLNGFNKGDAEIAMAIDSGVTINLDAPDELEQVARIARDRNMVARVGVRSRLLLHAFDSILSDWPAAGVDEADSTIGKNMRERDKFGVSPADFVALCQAALDEPSVELLGLHHHMGRERADAALFETTVTEQLALAAEIRDATGWVPSFFDFGGGMAFGRPEGHGPMGADRGSPTYEEYADAITGALNAGLARHGLGQPLLMIEPGRALASNTGIMLTTVGLRKPVPETNQVWLGVDACQNHLLNTLSGAFYYHPVRVHDRSDLQMEVVNIADPQCWYGNLAMNVELPRTTAGELIAFLDTGAYCESQSLNFNALPRPATVMVSEGRAEVVTRRETFDDVISRVQVPARLFAASDASEDQSMSWKPVAGEALAAAVADPSRG